MLNTLILKNKKRKLFLFAIISISSFFIAACGSAGNDTGADIPQGMQAVDLGSYGLPILINIPESTSPLEITENPQGGVNVRAGKNIQMTIIEGAGDMPLKKSDITHDDVRKFVKYVIEEPDAIVWEWQIEGIEPEFHFYAIIKAGEKFFEVRDIEGEMFSEKSTLQMLEIAKSIRLNETVKAES